MRIFIATSECNAYLKIIGKELNFNKPLHYHLSRHSAAVLFLSRGGSMEALSKLLSHNSIRTTEIYGKITNKKLDAEIDKVWG